MADLIAEFSGNYRKNDKKQRRVVFLKQNADLFTFSATRCCIRATSASSAPLHARTIAASSAIRAPDNSGPSDERYDSQVWRRICCDRTTGYMWFLSSVYLVIPSKELPSQGAIRNRARESRCEKWLPCVWLVSRPGWHTPSKAELASRKTPLSMLDAVVS